MAGSGDIALRTAEACGAHVATIGFRKRAGAVYTCPVADEVLGFLGLNSAANCPSGPFEINPVVGARHQPLERVVAELSGKKFHQYIPPSISTPLGYLMPESRYQSWQFPDLDSVDSVARSLGDAVDRWGMPYLRAHDSLDQVVAGLTAEKHAVGDQTAMRIAAGYALLGEHTRARQVVQQDLDALGDRQEWPPATIGVCRGTAGRHLPLSRSFTPGFGSS